ncbi:hypothetical protein EYZ11_003570 [Aspergillus tanneri]|uniref:ABC transporter domain-containing protein n=1 Tax=Aspergillus tanneri TaxID=1220188 RepID=A0A4S3JN02_9EURO|nr:hypothetical protein EYZ11_003570 [Aspergillus tanneri]
MSMIFRTIAATTRTVNQAMTIAVFYVYEALVANEFHGRQFACSQFIPSYPNLTGDTFVCSMSGAQAGHTTVSGDDYILAQYNSTYKHIWRNLGILIGFFVSFFGAYLVATELNPVPLTTPNVRIFRRGHTPVYNESAEDETNHWLAALQQQGRGHQECQNQKDEHIYGISGWAREGTLTALMGVSGAGKTTLLKILTQQVSTGIVSGDIRIGGRPVSESVRRDVGYVQYQNVLLPTSTVREALRFSACLRQPRSVSKEEKFNYAEEIIHLLQLDDLAEAVVGIPGAGLSEQQRKLVSLGVELAARPKLLLVLDEPTKELDSQASLSFYILLRRLADSGMAVLSTVNQPTAAVFELFDNLLLLAEGGRTVYFGETGNQSSAVLGYFERNGAPKCDMADNPAEYVMGLTSKGTATKNWAAIWRQSTEAEDVADTINKINSGTGNVRSPGPSEAVVSFCQQLIHVTRRTFQQYWREPAYVYGKLLTVVATALFIGFSSFKPARTLLGYQSVLYGTLNLMGILVTLVQQ